MKPTQYTVSIFCCLSASMFSFVFMLYSVIILVLIIEFKAVAGLASANGKAAFSSIEFRHCFCSYIRKFKGKVINMNLNIYIK